MRSRSTAQDLGHADVEVAASAPPGRPGATTYMRTLDGLRAVAVVLTSLVHLCPAVVPGGFLGVDVFFVLSGYLITTILLSSDRGRGRLPLRSFYVRRARRLVPPVLLLLLTFAVWELFARHTGYDLEVAAVVVVSVLLYVFNWAGVVGHQSPWQVDHLWSLSVEEQFYLVWPLLLMLLLRRYRRRQVVLVTASAAVLCVVAQTGVYLWTRNAQLVYLATPLQGGALLAGCVIAQVYSWGTGAARLRHLVQRPGAGLLGALALLTLALTCGVRSPITYEGGMAVAVLAAAAVVAGLVARESAGHVGRVLRGTLGSRLLVAIGKRSYSIYLWQNAVAWALTSPLRHSWSWLPANVLVTALCAQISYVCVERRYMSGREVPVTARQVSVDEAAVRGRGTGPVVGAQPG